jgi:hypothetical protein
MNLYQEKFFTEVKHLVSYRTQYWGWRAIVLFHIELVKWSLAEMKSILEKRT